MNLHTWLSDNSISTSTFAQTLGVSYQAVWSWRKAITFPSGKHLAEIEKLTRGKVTAKTWKDAPNA